MPASRTHLLALAAIPATLVLLPPASDPPVERVKVAGTFKLSTTRAQQLGVADAPGHMLLLAQTRGTNRSTGPARWADGAEVMQIYTADLVQGNGSHQGYNVEVSDGDTTFTRWSGRVKTVLSPGKKVPVTTFQGTWAKIGGTGRYQGISGSGRYEGRFTSATDYIAEWSGEVTVPRQEAAR